MDMVVKLQKEHVYSCIQIAKDVQRNMEKGQMHSLKMKKIKI